MEPDGRCTVFLDRDGVINVDSRHYIKNSREFHFIQGSAGAMALFTDAGWDIIVVTNQSGIGRGIIKKEDLGAIFSKMEQGTKEAGASIKDIFHCPHTPWHGCRCRKPAPGMIMDAVEKHNIDLSRSVMVGDSVKDIECGRAAGCAFSVLVLTGNGEESLSVLKGRGTPPDMVARDLLEAAEVIISMERAGLFIYGRGRATDTH
ncbi:MAG: D-glycero-beta-D-manno-heptose 1,7-bisphosphate 7-phosphatase [Desulfamplus sp.]|nr:D-glycero-beta-D-manno-heptose 1,7-bisphosphate 7-phosphatase [Desulfamplus sp.]